MGNIIHQISQVIEQALVYRVSFQRGIRVCTLRLAEVAMVGLKEHVRIANSSLPQSILGAEDWPLRTNAVPYYVEIDLTSS